MTTHEVTPELSPDQSLPAQIGRLVAAGLISGVPENEAVVLMPDGTLRRLEADVCGCGQCETLYRLLPMEAS